MKKKNPVSVPNLKQYRQGDVMLEPVSELPRQGLTAKPAEGGRLILAHGEVTGHAHAFEATRVAGFTGADGQEYFRITGTAIAATLPILRRWRGQVMVQHPAHGLLEFAAADVEIEGEEAHITGSFGLLRHDEHGTHAIPAGDYRGGSGGQVRQREYSPEEIRNVAD